MKHGHVDHVHWAFFEGHLTEFKSFLRKAFLAKGRFGRLDLRRRAMILALLPSVLWEAFRPLIQGRSCRPYPSDMCCILLGEVALIIGSLAKTVSGMHLVSVVAFSKYGETWVQLCAAWRALPSQGSCQSVVDSRTWGSSICKETLWGELGETLRLWGLLHADRCRGLVG